MCIPIYIYIAVADGKPTNNGDLPTNNGDLSTKKWDLPSGSHTRPAGKWTIVLARNPNFIVDFPASHV